MSAAAPPVRVGVIGCGRIARMVHLPTIAGLSEMELVAVAEADVDRRREAAGLAPGTVAVSGYADMIEATDVEAVVITLPTDLHAPAAIAALERGLHVYVEKPLARSPAEGRAVLAAWRAGLVGATGFNFRCHPLHLEARARLARGDIGRPLAMTGVFCSAARAVPDWKRTRSRGGGVLLDLASHHIDLARFLVGSEPARVSCEVRSVRAEDDTARLAVTMDDGVMVQGFYSTTGAEADRIELHGDEGRLVVDRYGGALEVAGARRPLSRGERARSAARAAAAAPARVGRALAAPTDPSFRASLSAFAAAVRSGDRPPADLRDGFRTLAVIEAAERSAREGRVMELEDDAPVGASSTGGEG